MANETNFQSTNKRKESEKDARKKTLRRVGLVIGSVFLIGALTCVIVFGYFFVNAFSSIYGDPIVDLQAEKDSQSLTTIIYARDTSGDMEKWIEYARLHGEENRIWIDLAGKDGKSFLPAYKNICNAYIALEDKRFWEHNGVDWVRFFGVISKYGFSQGASTLTQQLIKNVTGEKEVTVIRKYREILSALNAEQHYDKAFILEAYLNTLYLGRGCYGVKTGAEKYFGKEVDELSIAEAAVLASITKSPNQFDPMTKWETNKARALECISQMRTQDMITREEYNEAKAQIEGNQLIFTNSPDYKPSEEQSAAVTASQKEINSYYVDFLIEQVVADLMEQEELSKQEATSRVYYGGLKIYANVDLQIQEQMEIVYEERKTFIDVTGKDADGNPVQSAMAIMDYEGRVVGIVGGAGEKTQNRGLNRAAASWRQPGSTIKPIGVYGPAIDKDLITWSTKILNESFPYNGMMWPVNNDGTNGTGEMVTAQYGLQKSLNTISARIVNEYVKINGSYEWLSDKYGFTQLDPVNDRVLPALAVGGMTNGFSPLEECAAFAVFGNGGMYHKPYAYTEVRNYKETETILLPDTQEKRAFSEGAAKVMNEMLGTVSIDSYYSNGNGKYISKFKHFAKTGTTSDNKDRWFSAGTPYYVGTVWFGYDRPKDLGKMENPSAKIWVEVMNRIHENLDPKKKFPSTDEAVQKSYCTVCGKIASDATTSTATGWYKTDNLPGSCSGHVSQEGTAVSPFPGLGGNDGDRIGNFFNALF
ncbi:MAG: penicillin-binding protein [Oscillospiraceae bacterium]|jgi:penicillin-binding protein 1A|nr:penicillin-binding protein [Oscillospiraceae bacterium]